MSRIIQLEVQDWREHPHKRGSIEVQVKVPMKDGLFNTQWYEPNMHEVKRKYRVRGDNWDILVGKKVRIPALEAEAQKMGWKMAKRRKWMG